MKRSVLLQLSRDSIEEVLQMQQIVDKTHLLQTYPLLNEKIPTTIKLYLKDELRGYYKNSGNISLFDSVNIGAKKAAFEDENFTPLCVSQYLKCEIELILDTAEGIISERDAPLVNS
ncbi:AMMECR1 domain-containing protein [Sulfurimonas sp.]